MEDKLELLVRVLSEHELTRISYEEGEVRITMEKELPQVTNTVYASGGVSAEQVSPVVTGAASEEGGPSLPQGMEEVLSPLAGIYYSRPAPDSVSFVKEGSKVKSGDTMCIVESMKIMNEIKAPYDLTVVKVLKKDEEVAEYNEPLFLVKI